MKTFNILLACLLVIAGCKKKEGQAAEDPTQTNGITAKNETIDGLTFRGFAKDGLTSFKGILIMGSGNDENNPSAGALNGAAETALCQKAAENGYFAAIVQYRKQTATASNWNDRAKAMGDDFNQCIGAIATKYNIDKNKTVVGGYSYASFMLLTNNALNNNLNYCKGILAACGSTDAWKAQNFKIPVFSISCSGNPEGHYCGKELFDQIPQNAAVKARSGGVTDASCNSHCGGDWTTQLHNRLMYWLP